MIKVEDAISNLRYQMLRFAKGTEPDLALKMAIKALEERKTGKWIETGYVDGINVRDGKCSACGEWIDVKRKSVDGGLRYCPFCGVNMEVDDATAL